MKKWRASFLAWGALICTACGLSPNIDLPSFGRGESDSDTDTEGSGDDGGIGIGDGDSDPVSGSPPDDGAGGCSGFARTGLGGYGGATATQANDHACSTEE